MADGRLRHFQKSVFAAVLPWPCTMPLWQATRSSSFCVALSLPYHSLQGKHCPCTCGRCAFQDALRSPAWTKDDMPFIGRAARFCLSCPALTDRKSCWSSYQLRPAQTSAIICQALCLAMQAGLQTWCHGSGCLFLSFIPCWEHLGQGVVAESRAHCSVVSVKICTCSRGVCQTSATAAVQQCSFRHVSWCVVTVESLCVACMVHRAS